MRLARRSLCEESARQPRAWLISEMESRARLALRRTGRRAARNTCTAARRIGRVRSRRGDAKVSGVRSEDVGCSAFRSIIVGLDDGSNVPVCGLVRLSMRS